MNHQPAYTPYDGSSTPFTIGLEQLSPENWIEPDADLGAYLAQKHALLESHRDEIFRAEPGTEDAQREVLDLLSSYLVDHHRSRYSRDGSRMLIAGAHPVDLADTSLPPLVRAGLLVQDDLVIMRRSDRGWRIAAAFVAFPSSWSLDEKFGRSMDEVHADVPDFQAGSRNADLISRMFDRLPADRLVRRMNWSVNWNDALFTPKPKSERKVPDLPPAESFLRIERQSLRKLPLSGDILFTIRIYVDPVTILARQPDAARLMLSLADQLEALTPEQAAYKGLLAKRGPMIAMLRQEAEQRDIVQDLQ
ncbi:heme-dependent oxidative N-demethylase family protein [Rhizobium sp. SAFR-030]|uniref:heme-dependent oxidative N-demethylase family protein n=1 Tax=Rhizobium sp. SAFR-030 TaxID=3387277 RepID=UPI003F822E3F